MRHGKIGVAQGQLELGATIFQINTHAQHNKRAHGYDKQDFNGDFPYFTKDFGISTEISRKISGISRISGFQRRFPDSRKILDFTRAGKVYEISVSGGHLGVTSPNTQKYWRRNWLSC